MKRCLICGEENENNAEFCSCCQSPFTVQDYHENTVSDIESEALDDIGLPDTNVIRTSNSRKVALVAIVIIIIIAGVILFIALRNNEDRPSEDTYYEIGNEYEYVLPYSDSIYYDRSIIDGMNADETQLAINEIYARHGRIFESEPYYSYFNSLSWYYGEYYSEEFDEDWFNDYEIANINLLVTYAQEKGYR